MAERAPAGDRQGWGDRLVRLMPPLMVAVLVAVVIRTAARPVSDVDAWWHLRLGNDLLDQHSLAAPDWGRFATRPWTPSEPLPELLTATVERWFGLPGVAFVFGAGLAAVVATLYLTTRRRAEPLVAAVVTIMAALAASGSLTARPQLISFVFLPLVLMAWLDVDAGRSSRLLWWLVPLTWLWSLCHGFWFIGVAFSALCCVGAVVDRGPGLRRALRLALVPVASFAVVLLNPAGPGVLTAPFAVSDTKRYISEWQRTTPAVPWAWFAAVMLLAVAVVWVVRRRFSWLRLLLWLAALALLLYARRTVALSGLVAAPLLAEALQSLVAGRGAPTAVPTGATVNRPRGREVGALLAWCAACLVVLAVVVPATSDEPGDVPAGLDAQLDRLPVGTVVYNLYDVGGWLAWRHPDLTRVIDGLIVPYPNDFVDRYFASLKAEPGWQQTVADTRAGYALLEDRNGLTHALESAHWTPIGSSDGYVLLRASG